MRRWLRIALAGGAALIVLALGLYVWWSPTAGLPVVASGKLESRRELFAGFLGLLVLAVVAFGLDWQEWM